MELESTPALEAPIREVMFAALEDAGLRRAGAREYDDAWRRAALLEAVQGDEPEVGYALSPRSTLGATRA